MATPTCPNCGCCGYPGPGGHCPDCNYPPARRLILTGAEGNLSFGVRTPVGSTLLSKLSKDAKYAERDEQFTVHCRDSEWYILPRREAKNATLLNGRALMVEARLKTGDVIALGSASGIGKQVMQIEIGLRDE
jgi:pSer/pThr/pTyr-binding forkhead associated (FHA) protein